MLFLAPGVQREGEVRANDKGEADGLALAGQCLAKGQALGDQGGIAFIHGSHFCLLLKFEISEAVGEHAAVYSVSVM